MPTPSIAIVNCRELPEPDPDHEPLELALRARGAEVRTVAWDAESPELPAVDLWILRATWNYYHFPEQFLAWCRRVGGQARLVNPYPIIEWNSHKRYLLELADRGVATVPTLLLDRHWTVKQLLEACTLRGWKQIVLKPTISAASFQTATFGLEQIEDAFDFWQQQPTSRQMMAQPFISSTRTLGEKSIAWIDGEVTHAWLKHPRFAGQDERVEPTESLTEADRALVEQVLSRELRQQIFYARVDLMYDPEGKPLLSELELIEPSLQFRFSNAGLQRFANGLLRLATSESSSSALLT